MISVALKFVFELKNDLVNANDSLFENCSEYRKLLQLNVKILPFLFYCYLADSYLYYVDKFI